MHEFVSFKGWLCLFFGPALSVSSKERVFSHQRQLTWVQTSKNSWKNMPFVSRNISGKISNNLIGHFLLITFSPFYKWIIPLCWSTVSKYRILAISLSNLVELLPIFLISWHMFPVRLLMSGITSSGDGAERSLQCRSNDF